MKIAIKVIMKHFVTCLRTFSIFYCNVKVMIQTVIFHKPSYIVDTTTLLFPKPKIVLVFILQIHYSNTSGGDFYP